MTHTSDTEKYRVQLQFSPDRDGELYSKIHDLLSDVKARNRAHRVKQILARGLECQHVNAEAHVGKPTKVHGPRLARQPHLHRQFRWVGFARGPRKH